MKINKTDVAHTVKHKDEITTKAVALLRSPHFFARYFDLIHGYGLVGEERNAAVLMVAAVSRLLDKPLNVIVKGQSSSGKNFLVTRALRPLPRQAICELTSSSALAWNYASDDFRHRVVYLQERNEASGAVHPVRLLISEGRLVRIVTVNEGGVRKAKRFVAKGPIASISTTTKHQLEVDDETRHISLWVDESHEQTRRIVLAHSVQPKRPSRNELKVWRKVHELIAAKASSQVALPVWFGKLADNVYDRDVRVRRYFPAFVTACQAICLCRSFQHQENRTAENRKKLEVDFVDFAVAATLFESVFVESLHRRDEKNLETRAIVEELSQNSGKPVAAADLAKTLRISMDQAYAQLRTAQYAGVIRQVNKPEKANRKYFLPVPRPRFLPKPEEIFQRLPELGAEVRFVNPLTDEWVMYRRAGAKRAG